MSSLKLIFIFLAITVGGCLAACTESECTTVTDPKLRIRFVIEDTVRTSTGALRPQRKDTTIRIVRVTGIGNLSGRYVSDITRDSTTTSAISAFLSQVNDTTAFRIEWDTARIDTNRGVNSVFADTISVSYKRQPYFVSEGCGFNYKFTEIAIVQQSFTRSISRQILSVSVTNPLADETLSPNITILFDRRRR